MRIEILRAFLTTVQERSLSKAAELLYTSQSTVSRYIQELEKELGCKLFIRSRQGIRPTQAALMIYGQVQKLVNEWDQICFEAARYSSQSGTLRVGYVFHGIMPFISKAIDHNAAEYREEVCISLIYGQAQEICQMVLGGMLDCAIMHRPSVMNAPDLRMIRILPCSMSIMIPQCHPLAGEKQIEMTQLCRETECRAQRDPEFFAAAENAFYLKGLKPPKYVMGSDNADCYLLIRRNGYFGLRTSLYPPEEGCISIPVVDWPVDYDLMLVCRRDESNLSIDHFFASLQNVFVN